ncbi:Hypothetical protein LUCI_2829 [Lucifera butyrica]|uniref:Enoyl reductase (ER) domain-containing protein n=1 Tax=Lucifera butyrica TaxID=1351585 RepID=A0A498R7T1_9FIRM|nr:alcohol dehydrogenase catalytic domain-containing protein [Lucifera butyrica]VBB07564.1 Hypothetical protein LUCI_2829 [Lucifera butyrica]
MKALRKNSVNARDTELVEIPRPNPGYGEVLVKVMVAGLCGTDLRYYNTDEGRTKLRAPLIIGHEGSGIVVERGEGVTDINVGDRVVCQTTFDDCKRCEYCLSGAHHMCMNRTSLGSKVDGFFAQYVVCKAERIHKLPDSVSFEEGAMVEPLSCCVHAVLERSSLKPMDTCIIFGPGQTGLMCAQLARMAGARVILIGTGNSRKRLEVAAQLGFKERLIFDADDIGQYVMNITDAVGADVIIECSGSSQALAMSFQLVKKQGEILLVSASTESRVNLWDHVVLREVTIVGTLSAQPITWKTSIEILQQKRINVLSLVSARFELEDWEEAFRIGSTREVQKVLLYPNGMV